MIGAWGPIRFQVTSKKTLTFNNLKRTVSGTWNASECVGTKPIPTFSGPGLQEVSMEVVLDASMGVKPRKMIKQIEGLVESGQAFTMVIGRQLFGQNKWACIKSSEAITDVLKGGEIYRATLTLNFKEYL